MSNRINGTTAKNLQEQGALLLDVRSAGEYRSSHLDQAVNIPVAELSRRLKELDKKRPIIVYCRSGARSASAAGILTSSGFKHVHDLGPMRNMGAGNRASSPAVPADLVPPLLASLTLGLAPFVPEPHLFGKLRWVAGGAVGMQPMDWFDLVMHGAPVVWLLITAARVFAASNSTRNAPAD